MRLCRLSGFALIQLFYLVLALMCLPLAMVEQEAWERAFSECLSLSMSYGDLAVGEWGKS